MPSNVSGKDLKNYLKVLPNNGLENKTEDEQESICEKIAKKINIARKDRTYKNLADLEKELENSGISKNLYEAIIKDFIPNNERNVEQEKANRKQEQLELAMLQQELDNLDLDDKPNKTITQIKNISNKILDIYLETANHKLLHDAVTGIVALSAETVGVAGLLAGKASIKIAGVTLKLAGKVAKHAYKGAKGLAIKTAEKVEDIRNKRAIENVRNAKEISSHIKEELEQKVEDSTIDEKYIENDEKRNRILAIREGNLGDLSYFSEDLINENNHILNNIRGNLYNLKNKELNAELYTKLGAQPDQIQAILSHSAIDENGNIVLPKESNVSAEDIEKAGLTEKLKHVLALPKIDSLNHDEIKDLVLGMRLNNGQISFELNGEVSEKVKALANEFSGKSINIETLKDLQKKCDEHTTNDYLLKEVDARSELGIAEVLDGQMNVVWQKTQQIAGKEDKGFIDKRQRESLRKLAEKKVNKLRDAGIVGIIQDGKRKENIVMSKAENMLIGLDKAVEVKENKIDKMAEKQQNEGR